MHVFNITFWPEFYDIVTINLFLLWQKSFFIINFLFVCWCVQVNFRLFNQCRVIHFFNIRLDIFSKNESKNISFIIVVCWGKLCVQTRTNGDDFQGIVRIRDCAVGRHYEIVFIYVFWINYLIRTLKHIDQGTWIFIIKNEPYDR